jgi:hypothetical protein
MCSQVEDGVVDATFHDAPLAQYFLKGVNKKECKMALTGVPIIVGLFYLILDLF